MEMRETQSICCSGIAILNIATKVTHLVDEVLEHGMDIGSFILALAPVNSHLVMESGYRRGRVFRPIGKTMGRM
jgi:multisubunit Na+/H+ antiporter MnhG subunit